MFAFRVNGEPCREERDRNLLDYLRRERGLTSVKNGCGEGVCGACTVLVDGRKQRACLLKLSGVAGKEVLTVEGLSEREAEVYAWAFAIVTAWRTQSWAAPRRPKPPPRSTLWMSHFDAGRPEASAATTRAASPFWVGVQTSQRSAVTRAVAFIVSIVAWCWKG